MCLATEWTHVYFEGIQVVVGVMVTWLLVARMARLSPVSYTPVFHRFCPVPVWCWIRLSVAFETLPKEVILWHLWPLPDCQVLFSYYQLLCVSFAGAFLGIPHVPFLSRPSACLLGVVE